MISTKQAAMKSKCPGAAKLPGIAGEPRRENWRSTSPVLPRAIHGPSVSFAAIISDGAIGHAPVPYAAVAEFPVPDGAISDVPVPGAAVAVHAQVDFARRPTVRACHDHDAGAAL